MIISDSKKFVFLHVPKTGGRSVYQTLRDVSVQKCGPHTSPLSAREYLGNKFEEYFKFAFVRNPWDRLVAVYESKRRVAGYDTSFLDFVVQRASKKQFQSQASWIVEDRKLLVDFLGKYETFQDDFDIVCMAVGVEPRTLKEIGRSKRGPYYDYYTDRTMSLVEEMFAEDIELFGYSYGS